MSEATDRSANEPLPALTDGQSIVGVTRHRRTGAFIVWISLDGDDITPVGAWTSEETASEVMQETAHEFHRMVDAMDKAAPDEVEETGVQHWVDFLNEMKARSDVAPTPFDDDQLQDIARNIAQMLKQRRSVPNPPDDFARVLLYSDAGLQGTTMPRVQLTPMAMPPRRKGQKNKGQKADKEPLQAQAQNPLPTVAPIYLSYTDAGRVAPFFQVLNGADGLQLVKDSAKIMGRAATVLHTTGKGEDAPLEIVCVTDAPIDRARAEAISQKAINYAMETGLIPVNRDVQSGGVSNL